MKTYNLIAFLFLFSALLPAGQAGVMAQDTTNVKVESPVIALKIPLGKSITAGGEMITFSRVLEDSRCPEGTQCVWEGQVRVEVQFSNDEMKTSTKTAIVRGMTTPQIMENATHIFTVMGVNPYPQAQEAQENRNYELLLKVDVKKQG